MVDHVHLLLRVDNRRALSQAIDFLKGACSRRLFQQFPELAMDTGTDRLWQHRFGSKVVPDGAIRRVSAYIRTQDQRLRQIHLRPPWSWPSSVLPAPARRQFSTPSTHAPRADRHLHRRGGVARRRRQGARRTARQAGRALPAEKGHARRHAVRRCPRWPDLARRRSRRRALAAGAGGPRPRRRPRPRRSRFRERRRAASRRRRRPGPRHRRLQSGARLRRLHGRREAAGAARHRGSLGARRRARRVGRRS